MRSIIPAKKLNELRYARVCLFICLCVSVSMSVYLITTTATSVGAGSVCAW